MKVYVMRHGTTIWNEKGITQGRTNNRLSNAGKQNTEVQAEFYKDIKFDIILCSPLFRTVQTANIMNKYHNVKIIRDENLIEIEQGIFTGRHKDSLSPKELELKNSKSKECGMESYESVYKRTQIFIEKLKSFNYKTVLIITHNCNASYIEDIILNKNIDFNDKKFNRNFKNAEIKEFNI